MLADHFCFFFVLESCSFALFVQDSNPDLQKMCGDLNAHICGIAALREHLELEEGDADFLQFSCEHYPSFFALVRSLDGGHKSFTWSKGSIKESPIFIESKGPRKLAHVRIQDMPDPMAEMMEVLDANTEARVRACVVWRSRLGCRFVVPNTPAMLKRLLFCFVFCEYP